MWELACNLLAHKISYQCPALCCDTGSMVWSLFLWPNSICHLVMTYSLWTFHLCRQFMILIYCPVVQDSLGCIPFTHHFCSTCQSHKVSGKLNLSSLTHVMAVNCTTVAVVSCFGPPGLWGQLYQLIRWKILLLNILGGPNFGCLRYEGRWKVKVKSPVTGQVYEGK